MHRIDNDTPAIGRTVMVLMMLAAAVTSGMASASDEMEGRGRSARKIVMHDDELISPSALTMNRDDVLEFENDSGQLMRLVFVEPEDQREKVRCHLVNRTSARLDETPRLVLDWDAGKRLTTIIPPGTFASVCSLAPGRYAFVARRVSRDPRGGEDSLGTKGTITVE
jgi:hypothetical protein